MIIVNFRKEEKEKDISGLWQYDYGQILRIQGLDLPAAVEIHFSLQSKGGEAVTRVGTTRDEVTDVVIPDSMLENNYLSTDYSIYVFIYLTDETSGETAYKICMRVRSRPKPEAFDTPEDAELFRDAIAMVNEAANRAAVSEDSAKDYETKAGRHYEETRTLAEQVSQEKETVMSTAQEVAKRAETVSLQTERTAKDAQEVATSVAQVRLLMEQNIQTAKQITEDRAEVEKLAEQVSDNADKASTSASEASTSAKNASASEKNVKTDAQEVAQKAQKVSSDMNKVTELAQKAKEYAEAAKNGVQGDWTQNDPTQSDHIKGRTHYVRGVTNTEVFPKTEITFSDGAYQKTDGAFGLVEGNTYTVTYCGVDYVCECIKTESDGMEFLNLGNVAQTEGGEPFIIIDVPLLSMAMVVSFDGVSSGILGISYSVEDIVKIPNKFIDAEWMATVEKIGNHKTILEEMSITGGSATEIQCDLIWGNTYTVTFDGIEYSISSYELAEAGYCLGDSNFYDGGTGRDYPFLVIRKFEDNRTYIYCESGKHTIGIDEGNAKYNEIPQEFLPKEPVFTSVILKSSTQGSTKKFKVTVDDTGTIKATEITE